MKCPIDDTDLLMTERQGIEIDYCPKCRGVWLDRGELDKVIERSAGEAAQAVPPERAYEPRRDDRRYEERLRYDERPRYHKKRKSMLGELFDF